MAVVGPNAQGKSNLLEAIYYLELFRSFRQAPDKRLVAFGAELFRVEAKLEPREGPRLIAAAYRKRDGRKKAFLDGAERVKLAEAVGHLGAVMFSPDDATLVSGGPGVRRRFLDIVLSLNCPGYLAAAQNYRRALTQRNAALRASQSDAAVAAWNGMLADAGSRLVTQRRSWIEMWSSAFSAYYRSISGDMWGSMSYRPGIGKARGADILLGADTLSVEDVEEVLRMSLEGSLERDRRQGATQLGPHRDDLRLGIRDDVAGETSLDLHAYSSGGQRRTAALALRLIEARTVREVGGHRPLLLLDDVFAELDERRSERVLRAIEAEEFGQVVLAAPKESEVRVARDSLVRWSIDAGRVAA